MKNAYKKRRDADLRMCLRRLDVDWWKDCNKVWEFYRCITLRRPEHALTLNRENNVDSEDYPGICYEMVYGDFAKSETAEWYLRCRFYKDDFHNLFSLWKKAGKSRRRSAAR